jgi:hypothetical protein
MVNAVGGAGTGANMFDTSYAYPHPLVESDRAGKMPLEA